MRQPETAAKRRRKKDAGRTRGPSPEKTAQTRQTIISAALAEFLEKGFADATMEGVARRAGLAKGTSYRYFPTKEALFSGVVRQEIAGAHIEVDAAKRRPDETVKAFLRRTMLVALRGIELQGRSAIARLVIIEGVRFPALVEIYREELIGPLMGQIRRLARDAWRSGETKDDRLVKFPQLLTAPIWMGILNNELLDTQHPVDIGGLFAAQLEVLFPDAPARPRSRQSAHTGDLRKTGR